MSVTRIIEFDMKLEAGLRRLAEKRGVSKAEAIRQVLAEAIESEAPQPRITAIAVGRGPGGVLSDDFDRSLRDAGFGE